MEYFKALKKRFLTRLEYDQIRAGESIEKSYAVSDSSFADQSNAWVWPLRNISNLVLLAIIQGIVIASLLLALMRWHPSDLQCARQLSPYSPYLETSNLEYEEFTDQNHLMQPSPYRGHPTPEIEEAWIKLWRLPRIEFPASKLDLLNKTPADSFVHSGPEQEERVVGFLDVFHQLHCLNMIRQYTYRDEYDYSNMTAFRAPPDLVRGHVDHCIETIRKALMCISDVTPMVFIKDSSRASGGKSDFNTKRKCRNFQNIQAWALKNGVYI